MPPMRIERLTLKHFRGGCKPVTFEFAKDKNIVLLFGENGAGKSSIADALDFVCNGEFGSLRNRSGTMPRVHVVSVGAASTDLEVELVYGGQTWRAALQGGKPKTSPAGAPPAFILRRTDITRVMEATASDRYKALQAFITAPKVERAEGELRRAAKEVSEEVNRAATERQLAETALDRFWQAEGRPGKSSIDWAVQQTREDAVALNQRLTTVRRVLDQLERLADAHTQIVDAHQKLAEVKVQAAAASAELQQMQEQVTGENGALVAVLEEARRYVAGAQGEIWLCPVCGKPEQGETLAARIEEELRRLSTLKVCRDASVRATQAVEQAKSVFDTARRHLRQHADAFVAALQQTPAELTAPFAELAAALADPDGTTVKQAAGAISAVISYRTTLMTALDADQKTLNQLSALKSHLQVLAASDADMRDLQQLAMRLGQMLEVVEGERKRYVSELMDSIAESVAALYRRMHPDEPLGRPSFHVKAQAAGSLDLKANFGDKAGVPPGAYYSEAHLDTLGLCVYLALAKHSGAGNALVVMDDVLTSVDDVHLDRIIDLIADEAPNFGHLIITTHSRAWYDRMRTAKGMQADLIELYGWDLGGGIRHSRSPLMVEELRDALAAPRLDRQAVASKTGILLEQLLDELTLRYGCKMVRKKEPIYTLGELASAFDGKLLKLLRTERVDRAGAVIQMAELKPLIEAATEYTWVRNQAGAHFNVNAASIPDNMVREFARRALALADALVCPQCGQLPKNNKSGEYWQCGGTCKTRRLRPLQAPA